MSETPLRIGIVGAGFSGAALAAQLHRNSRKPIDIVLFDKTGTFGCGDAYRTPYPHHLLNVRAQDMSVFEQEQWHFVEWLTHSNFAKPFLDPQQPVAEQFVPRLVYGSYLQEMLQQIQAQSPTFTRLEFEPSEVIDLQLKHDTVCLKQKNQKETIVDKVILALGNNPPTTFPFPVSPEIVAIRNPWDYTALSQIKSTEPVLIVGTGLSMIDAVLTLQHQQHQGKIYALSRHGLLPLSHADVKVPFVLLQEELPTEMRQLARHLRGTIQHYVESGGDWRSVINALRQYIPALWNQAHQQGKRQFLRHVLPYWNVHRHRVHHQIAVLLE